MTRRQGERETGASWIAVDLETGSDVWIQLSDHGGLARAAEAVRGLTPPAAPTVLDTGELRMSVDSRALAALRGGEEGHAAHTDVVIEFVVLKPLAGRGLAAKIQRRALPPAEGLAIAAMLADTLDEALPKGGSHGWLNAGSVWPVRRGGCVLDLAPGLAYPDGAPIAMEQQVSGYFAPERLAVSGEPGAAVGSGSAATEAADVFALGWMLYEMLIGHAELLAEYERLVAGAGAVTTVELLALWRARARVHLTELVEADSPLAVLALACLAEKPLERPELSAFAERARGVGAGLAGVAPLVAPAVRTRVAAAEVVEAVEIAAVAGAGLMAGELAGGILAETGTASTPMSSGVGAGAGVGTSGAEAGAVGGESGVGGGDQVGAGAGAGAAVLATAGVAGAGAAGVAVLDTGREGELDRLAQRAKFATIGGVAAAVVALGVGLVVGYAIGHNGHGGSSTVLTAAGADVGANAAGGASASRSPAPSSSPTVVATVTGAGAVTGTISSSPVAAAVTETPTAPTSPPLPAPSSTAEAVGQLNQEVQYELSIGQITSATASRLTTAIVSLENSVGTGSFTQSLSSLTSQVRSLAGSGELPSGAELTLESILGYFYSANAS